MSKLCVEQLQRNIGNSSDLSFQCHFLLPCTVFCTTSQQARKHLVTTVNAALILLLKIPNINVMKTGIAGVDLLQPCSYMQANRHDKLGDQRYAAVV
jgi:hypothetical protein